jgi:hypothetical protein
MGQWIVHIIMNQELTKAKIEGVVIEVAWMGQQINHVDKKFEEMEKKWTNCWLKDLLLILHLSILGVDDKLLLFSPEVSF